MPRPSLTGWLFSPFALLLLAAPTALAQGRGLDFYMEFVDAKVHAPVDATGQQKSARFTARIRVSARQNPAILTTARFELRDAAGKPLPFKLLTSPLRKANVPGGPGETVVEFDAGLYGAAPEPGERYLAKGVLPSGQSFGRVLRFEASPEPLPEEPWEKEAAKAPAKGKRKK